MRIFAIGMIVLLLLAALVLQVWSTPLPPPLPDCCSTPPAALTPGDGRAA